MKNKYPIYVISKGRWENQITISALREMGADFRVAVESEQCEKYIEHGVEESRIVELPFNNHGLGSGPARNYCWEHSIKEGHARHWLLDDNIFYFCRFHGNIRYRVKTPEFFRVMEDFTDRYTNIAMSGPDYRFFTASDARYNRLGLNRRVMSCILIDNSLPFRWRCKYNEDIDLYFQSMKAGYCSILFRQWLIEKAETQSVKGGNTEELYGSGTYDKSRMLAMVHPDCAKVVSRYGREHHEMDIRQFQGNRPILKDVLPEPVKYDMVLVERQEDGSLKRLEPKQRKNGDHGNPYV